ncbi:NAD(P)/FAD-dependent oxidoreductase [Xylophilus sp. GOD-11R]|uniref:NAD(P)/FAD-dependent oxidoreductase n=1 Tax=Xylophilus sp. GOD-11R TaxID=3089814 RepID=UPI00298C4A78|nr:NAD(P)/FAD-dependent oxidoreductase [Xylophilus sp. GOD-11R]WPB56548.1 NAD(P)/FAD-dependent oxidoreductase [Xylophilus sp. GOD-11R]
MSPAERALADRVTRAQTLLRDHPPDWVPPREGTDHDVLIVGGGQSGLNIGFALRRAGIGRIAIVDRAAPGAEGVWSTIARMPTLRTAKSLTGPESGIAELSFQAWYEAVHGAAAYDALERIPRDAWANYLGWYREATGARVRHHTTLLRVEPAAAGLHVALRLPDGRVSVETTRKLVLSTGVDGCGAPRVPEWVARSLPRDRYSHTADTLPSLAGARVAVLGAAASAFDAAATALEQGARTVHLFCRQPDLARRSRMKALSHVGGFEFFHQLPDATRWALMRSYRERGGNPPRHAVLRATRHENFHLHLGSTLASVRLQSDGIVARAGDEEFTFDHLLLGTGYTVDLALRPELAAVAPHASTWGDHWQPAWGSPDTGLARHPYLGAGFEFLPRTPGTAPWLSAIHCFAAPAMASHGRPVGDTGSLRHNVPRLVSAIGRDLFLADADWQVAHLQRIDADELDGSEYAHRVWSPAPISVA